jgi:glycosyltransferase involved in cell wall biosynthesis
VISYSGLINRNKGVDTLLRSLLLLAEKRNDFSVQLLGNVGSIHGVESEDDFADLLHELISQLQARGILVDRPGYLPWDGVSSRLARASIHVVPSRWQEPFPLSALEGMACGLATVASTSGGLPELVGEAGLTFDAEDINSLAGHLEALVASPEMRAHYGRLARQRAETFTWNRTWQSLYARLDMNSASTRDS